MDCISTNDIMDVTYRVMWIDEFFLHKLLHKRRQPLYLKSLKTLDEMSLYF